MTTTPDRTTTEGTAAEKQVIRLLYVGEPSSVGPDPADLTSAGDRLELAQEPDFARALERVRRDAPDCVVAVHRSDGFDGVAFLEGLRRERAELPVVLVPSSVDGSVARRAVAADATALVPAGDDDAVETIVETVERTAATAPERSTRMPISDLTLEEERRLKERALDEAPVGITISDAGDPQNPIIYANDAFVDITGYGHEEAVGVNHRFLQGPDTDPEKVARLKAGIEEKRDVRVVLRNYTSEGTPFWNQVDISPIRDADGDVTHYVGFQMDVTERERAKRELEAEREALDRLLDRVNGLINEVTETLVRADSREEVESLTVERFETGDEYDGVWLGRYDAADERVTVTHSTDAGVPETTVDLDADDPGVRTLREVVADRTASVVTDTTGLPAVGSGPGLLVPLSYRSTTYGVIAVFDDDTLLDDRERVLLESLGRSIGTSINDLLTKRTMTTDTVLNIAVDVVGEHVLSSLADDLGCTFEQETTMTDDRDEGVVALVSTTHDAEAVVERADAYDAVREAEVIVDDEDESMVQLRLAESPLVDVLSGAGGRLTSVRTDGTSLQVEFRAGTEDAARNALEDLEERYDRVELRAYHEVDEPTRTPSGFREEIRNRLTDRQLTALEKAYVSGFFEWPRRADGEQLAESMDIVPSTYHQHLQAAKRKLVGAFFEE